MANLQNHIERWKHNRRFLATIDREFSDWMVTVAFYTAVHAVESLFVYDRTGNHTDHESRNRTLRSVNRYQKIWRAYRPLLEASQTVRYYPEPDKWVPCERAQQELIPSTLLPLERSVRKLAKISDELPRVEWLDS